MEKWQGALTATAVLFGANSFHNFTQDNNGRENEGTRLLGAVTTDHIQDAFGIFGKQIMIQEKPDGGNIQIDLDTETMGVVEEATPHGNAVVGMLVEVR